MIKDTKNATKDENTTNFTYKYKESMTTVYEEPATYSVQKNKIEQTIAIEEFFDIKILEFLEQIGFPMEELGTILYKDVIVNVIKRLMNSSSDKENEMLKEELTRAFSQIYFDISRNEYDMGLKTFHDYIKHAISNIIYNQKNESAKKQLCNQDVMSYGPIAFDIAYYMLKPILLSEQIQNTSKECYNIKKLSNIKKFNI